MPRPFITLSQSDSLIQIVDTNSDTKWQTVQIQISWLLQKPTDLDLHCLQRQGISGLSRTRVKSPFRNIFFSGLHSETIDRPVLSVLWLFYFLGCSRGYDWHWCMVLRGKEQILLRGNNDNIWCSPRLVYYSNNIRLRNVCHYIRRICWSTSRKHLSFESCKYVISE